jgi:hypothetical protein
VKETVLYEPNRNPDMTELSQRWTFAAHKLDLHVGAVVSENKLLFLEMFIVNFKRDNVTQICQCHARQKKLCNKQLKN